MTYAEVAKLTLDFMLAGIEISMILFSVFMGISLFQREMTLGSVSMVLSKPISRASFLVGKYLGQLAVQWAVTFAMALLTIVIGSHFGGISVAAILQTCLLISLEISVLTAMAYFFAVNAGAITAAISTLCLFFVGHLRESVSSTAHAESKITLWKLVRMVLPDLEVFNMKSLASYGHTISSVEVGWATLYAMVCVFFFLLMAVLCFNEKDILT
jgi:ABC-type transport system involved in multi-copper enzyme maturation permease subunit